MIEKGAFWCNHAITVVLHTEKFIDEMQVAGDKQTLNVKGPDQGLGIFESFTFSISYVEFCME